MIHVKIYNCPRISVMVDSRNVAKTFATHCAIFLQQGLLLENMASRTTPPPQRDQRPAGQIVVVLQRRCEVNYNNLTD